VITSPPPKKGEQVVIPVPTPTSAANFKTKSANYRWPSYTVELEGLEKKQKFNTSPGLYAVLMGRKGGETKDSPISFAYADCSLFLIETGTINVRSQTVEGLLFELTIAVTKLFIAKEDASLYDPLVLSIDR
jgi:hypothetical protein